MGFPRLSLTEKQIHLRMRGLNYSAKDISQVTGNSLASVYRTFNNADAGRHLMPISLHKVGRPRKLNNDDIDYLEDYLAISCDAQVFELVEVLRSVRGIDVDESTVLRSLKRRGITRKKLTVEALERNEDLRDLYRLRMTEYHPEQLVFADESAHNRFTSQRDYGWSFEGDRARHRDFFARGEKHSVLPALSLDGVLYFTMVHGSHNADSFNDFVAGLLDVMNPFPGPNSVLVVDNAKIHKSEVLRPMVEAHGMRLEYLPPYSPDLNPIEEGFAAMKAWIRAHRIYVRSETTAGANNAHVVLSEAIGSMTAEKTRGWFTHAGYIVPADVFLDA